MAAADRRSRRNSSVTRVLLALTLVGVLVFAVSVGLVLWLVGGKDSGKVTEGSFLEVELEGPLHDAPAQGGLFLEPDDFPPLVTEISAAVRQAATDDRIEGVYLDLNAPSGGWASFQEIRQALVELREAGKPCVAYAEVYTTDSYWLASACDEVILAPGGITLVNGLASSVTYYAGTFEKLGIQAEFEHVGDFKSAVEPYERTGPSEPAALAMNEMLDGLYGELVSEVASGRGLDEAAVRAMVDRPPMSPREALDRGLVDALAYRDQVRARLSTVGTVESWASSLGAALSDEEKRSLDDDSLTPLKEYLKGLRVEQRGFGPKIAVVHAEGAIVSGEAEGGLFGDSMLADKTFAKWMEKARENDDVEAVVLRIDSPGGSGLASDMMWREIRRVRDEGKPVVVSMGDYAASGGYYIATAADHVVAQPTTLTGSIGVFGGKLDLSGTYEKLGLTQHQYKRGEVADLLSSTQPFSEAGRDVYRGFLQDFYDLFLERVAEGREMSVDQVHEVAQGRVWTGAQALDRGLVDELGGLDVAVAHAAELAGLESYGVLRLPEQKGFFDLLIEDLSGGSAAVRVELPGLLDSRAARDLVILERVLQGAGVAALLPGNLEVR